jgi:nucleolar GTP-binding protein
MVERGRKREREDPRVRRRAERAAAADKEMEDAAANDSDEEMQDGRGLSKGAIKRAKKEREQSVKREKSLARSHSRPREPSQMGLKDESMAKIAKKVESKGQMRWHGGKGEGDHTQSVHLVKWMNTGKKRNGTHYCR